MGRIPLSHKRANWEGWLLSESHQTEINQKEEAGVCGGGFSNAAKVEESE